MKKGKEMEMMKGMNTMMEGMDWGASLFSIVLMALGLWFLAGGFVTQLQVTGRNFDWMVAVWYAVGVALVWWGKMWGWKSCGCYE